MSTLVRVVGKALLGKLWHPDGRRTLLARRCQGQTLVPSGWLRLWPEGAVV